MDLNTDAESYLDYYLDLPGDPYQAVMLVGAWGSGKSHFIDTYFDQHRTAARAHRVEAKEEIRVTLFGISSFDDVMSQIFAKAHPRLGGKAAKAINIAASKLSSLVNLSLDSKENEQLLREMMLNLDGRVLIFDDFERCPLPVVETMGFINRFVEQDKLKVIVVASETDIDPVQMAEYRRRKEKLIGKTIEVGSDPGEVLDHFVRELKSDTAIAAVHSKRDELLETFKAAGRPNFRSLRAILSDFDLLIGAADPKLAENSDALVQLLHLMLATGLEFRTHHIDRQALEQLTANMRFSLGRSGGDSTPERASAHDIRDRYPHVDWRDPIVPTGMLGRLFESGTVDRAAFNAHLSQHPRVVGTAAVPSWRLLWNWYGLAPSAYRDARRDLLSNLKAHKIVEPGELLHAAGTMLQLKAYGDDLLERRSIERFFKNYLSALAEEDKLKVSFGLFDVENTGYGGLGYQEADSPAFRKIRAQVEKAATAAMNRRLAREAPRLMADLSNKSASPAALFEWGPENRHYGGLPILVHVDPGAMADLLFDQGKLDEGLISALSARYERASSFPAMAAEKPWVLALHRELKRRLRSAPAPYKRLSELRLEAAFERILAWAGVSPNAAPSPSSRGQSKTKGQPTPPGQGRKAASQSAPKADI